MLHAHKTQEPEYGADRAVTHDECAMAGVPFSRALIAGQPTLILCAQPNPLSCNYLARLLRTFWPRARNKTQQRSCASWQQHGSWCASRPHTGHWPADGLFHSRPASSTRACLLTWSGQHRCASGCGILASHRARSSCARLLLTGGCATARVAPCTELQGEASMLLA